MEGSCEERGPETRDERSVLTSPIKGYTMESLNDRRVLVCEIEGDSNNF